VHLLSASGELSGSTQVKAEAEAEAAIISIGDGGGDGGGRGGGRGGSKSATRLDFVSVVCEAMRLQGLQAQAIASAELLFPAVLEYESTLPHSPSLYLFTASPALVNHTLSHNPPFTWLPLSAAGTTYPSNLPRMSVAPSAARGCC